MGETGQEGRQPGWSRLFRHSHRLALPWLVRGIGDGYKAGRVGLGRLLTPMDPWRYYEMGRVAEEPFVGSNLDVSSPKLLASLLNYERQGSWLAVDLFEEELEKWHSLDPRLPMKVEDATRLSFSSAAFDNVICISVVEHIAGEGDTAAMREMFRVLKPGGHLYLTTNVSRCPKDVWVGDRPYGPASPVIEGRTFFERHYSIEEVDSRLLREPWEVIVREYASEVDKRLQDRFMRFLPWSYLLGNLLPLVAPRNFRASPDPGILDAKRFGVLFLKLRKPFLPPD